MELIKIKGINEKRISDLNKMGIFTQEDLIRHFPKNYLDLTKITPLRDTYNNDMVLTLAKVVTMPRSDIGGRRKYVKIYCEQGGDTFSVIWFNQPYVEKQIKIDTFYFFYGRVQNKYGMISMVNPTFETLDKNYKLKGIVPVYSVKGKLSQRIMRTSILNAISQVSPVSVIPENLINKYALSDLKKSFYDVHNPFSEKIKQSASERVALEEYFTLISAFKIIKGDKKTIRTSHYDVSAKDLKHFTQQFGFELTEGQKKAVNEIFADMHGVYTMNRLLQGDVGSGKTAVSLCAMFLAVKSGYQTVMLAPTEVLAKQNFSIISRFFDEKIAFLSGSLTTAEKKKIKENIKNGYYKIVVGTHAILENNVQFENLSLCICDEQQRFGVGQRTALLSKGRSPDVLVMSATPIPRTLSLIFYGDLDISTITDKPVSRKEIQTNIVPDSKYDDMLEFIRQEIKCGNQAYFVCPKIEEDDEGTLMSVTELYEDISARLSDCKVALLHGKMKDKEKNTIMQDFKDKKYDALCSTTVIEVGVDVPDATVITIYNSERFGLSQLHQLRGRVGRSDKKSYCFLLCSKESKTSVERLKIMKESSDGFKIAETDYEIRGGGDFLGLRQSGKFIGNLGALNYSTATIMFAKKLSDEAFETSQNIPLIKKIALEKYEKLKDVSLN